MCPRCCDVCKDERIAARIGRQACQVIGAAYYTAKGRRASRVRRQAERSIDRADKTDWASARVHGRVARQDGRLCGAEPVVAVDAVERRVVIEGRQTRGCNAHRGTRPARIGRQACQVIGAAYYTAKGRRTSRINIERKSSIDCAAKVYCTTVRIEH